MVVKIMAIPQEEVHPTGLVEPPQGVPDPGHLLASLSHQIIFFNLKLLKTVE